MNYQQELNKAYTALDNMKKLIEDRKNLPLTVGTWYNIKLTGYTDAVICYQGENSYGWGHLGVWTDCYQIPFGSRQVESDKDFIVAKMIVESNSRFKGKIGKCLHGASNLETDKVTSWTFIDNALSYCHNNGSCGCAFENGQWADVIEEKNYEDLIDLKKHNEGGVVLFEKPRPGDICKFWDDDENFFIISKLSHYTGDTYGYVVQIDMDFLHYKNAKVVSEEEVIELLFKSK